MPTIDLYTTLKVTQSTLDYHVISLSKPAKEGFTANSRRDMFC